MATKYQATPAFACSGADFQLMQQAAASAAQKPGRAQHQRRRKDAARAHAVAAERRAVRQADKPRAVPAFPAMDDPGALFPSTDDDGADGSRMLAGWL